MNFKFKINWQHIRKKKSCKNLMLALEEKQLYTRKNLAPNIKSSYFCEILLLPLLFSKIALLLSSQSPPPRTLNLHDAVFRWLPSFHVFQIVQKK